MIATPLAAVPLAEAGHMLRPRIFVGGATHKHGSQKAISWGPQRNSQPQRAGQKWGGLERGDSCLSRGQTMVRVGCIGPKGGSKRGMRSDWFQMDLQTHLMLFADGLDVGKAPNY